MSRFILEELMHSNWTALRKTAQGYEIPEYASTKIFPIVQTKSPRVFIPKYNKEHLKIVESARAMDTEVAFVKPATMDSSFINIGEYALKTQLDHRRFEALESTQTGYDIIKHESLNLTHKILNESEKFVSDLLQDVSTYSMDHVSELTAPDKWTDVDSDPIKQIYDGYEVVKSKGFTPNFIFFGRNAWRSFRNHNKVISEIYGKDPINTVVSTEQVLSKLEPSIKEIIIAGGQYDNNGTFEDFFNDVCIVGRKAPTTNDQVDMFTASAGYQLRGADTLQPKITTEWTDKSNLLFDVTVQIRLTNTLLEPDCLYLIKGTNA